MLEKLSHSPHALTYSKHMFNPKFLSWLNAHADVSFSSCNQAATAESKLQNHSTVTLYVLQEMLSIKNQTVKGILFFFFFCTEQDFCFWFRNNGWLFGLTNSSLCCLQQALVGPNIQMLQQNFDYPVQTIFSLLFLAHLGVTSHYLSYHCFAISLNQFGVSPLTSGISKTFSYRRRMVFETYLDVVGLMWLAD